MGEGKVVTEVEAVGMERWGQTGKTGMWELLLLADQVERLELGGSPPSPVKTLGKGR